MRRYRYGDPSVSGFRKWGSFVYFLAAWNVFGYIAYKVWSNKKRQQDPEWDNLSSTQKYLQLISTGDRKVEKIKISGLSVEHVGSKQDMQDEK